MSESSVLWQQIFSVAYFAPVCRDKERRVLEADLSRKESEILTSCQLDLEKGSFSWSLSISLVFTLLPMPTWPVSWGILGPEVDKARFYLSLRQPHCCFYLPPTLFLKHGSGPRASSCMCDWCSHTEPKLKRVSSFSPALLLPS